MSGTGQSHFNTSTVVPTWQVYPLATGANILGHGFDQFIHIYSPFFINETLLFSLQALTTAAMALLVVLRPCPLLSRRDSNAAVSAIGNACFKDFEWEDALFCSYKFR